MMIFWGQLCLIVAGCADKGHGPTSRPASAQERALRDPMGYRPDMSDTDVSGGGIGEFDRKAVKRDLNHVLNP